MNKNLLLATAVLIVSATHTVQLQATDFSKPTWTLSEEKNNVTVYTRGIAGNENGRAIKAVTYVEQSPASVLALVVDYPAAPRWRRQIKSMEKIKVIDENSWYIRTVSDLPWPLSDRVSTLKCHVEKFPETQTIAYRFNTAPEMMSQDEMEGESIEGVYEFAAMADGSTRVTFEMFIVSPMKVPDWLIKSMMGASFIDQMVLLRKVVAEPEYAKVGMASFGS